MSFNRLLEDAEPAKAAQAALVMAAATIGDPSLPERTRETARRLMELGEVELTERIRTARSVKKEAVRKQEVDPTDQKPTADQTAVVIVGRAQKSKSPAPIAEQEIATPPNEELVPSAPSAYTVVHGDTVFNIAKTYLGDGNRYSELAEAADALNSDRIEAGQSPALNAAAALLAIVESLEHKRHAP